MDRQIGLPAARLVLTILLCAGCAALTGCQPTHSSRMLSPEGVPLTVASIDEGAGGLKVTVAELLPAAGDGRLQAYGVSNVRSQTFVSLADAAWQWERKEPPGLIAIGEGWVRAHGFPSTWAKQLGRLGLPHGRRPLVAVTEGAAEALVRDAQAAREGAGLLRKAGWSSDPLPNRTYSYEDDLMLPYLSRQRLQGAETGVSAQAVLFKKGELIGTLTPQQTELLSCLQGQSNVPALTWAQPHDEARYKLEHVSCHSVVRGNGDLLHPRLTVRLRIQGTPGQGSGSKGWSEPSEQALHASFTGLVRYLQDRRTDPLRWGDSFRAQYAGIWSPDRWRTAFAGADVRLQIHVKLNGGTYP